MSRRKLNKQQRARIQQIQTSHLELDPNKPHQKGLVICCFGTRATIETPEGTRVDCAVRPNLPALVAGDQIIWQAEAAEHGVVISLVPRYSLLERLNKDGKPKPTAANITQMMIVIAPKPEPSWALVDSYLIVATQLNLRSCIVLNKVDLPHACIKTILQDHYATLSIASRFITKTDPKTYRDLEQQLAGQTSVFVGQSGVGKSSLIQHLLPHETNIQIGQISEAKALGRHTTSLSYVYHLPEQGMLIDSPGVRSFQPMLTLKQIIQGYPEFHPFLQNCKFRNCPHHDTSACGIIKAVAEGKVSAFRYENFVKILTLKDSP